MANFYKSEVVAAMREQALVPVFYSASKDVVLEIVAACARGGSRLIEFTNRGEGAADVFGEVVKVCRKQYPDMILGVGSIRDEVTAGIYIGKGADFVVGPTFNPRVSEICNRLGVSYSPGCGTASEINNAEAAGAEIVKVFPGGQVGGPAFFKAVHGPSANTQMMPTGGVEPTAESIYGWLAIGDAAALGIGGELIKKDLVAKKDWAGIEANVRKAIHIIRCVRNKVLASEGVLFKGVQHVGVGSADMNASFKILADLAGFRLTRPAGATLFIAGAEGPEIEVGPADKVKDPGHIAVEVTDMAQALDALAKAGIKPDGEVATNPDKTAKTVYLAEGAFGFKLRVHLFARFSEAVDSL